MNRIEKVIGGLTLFGISLFIVTMLITGGLHPFYGFLESEFVLHKESELPSWFDNKSNYSSVPTKIEVKFYSFNNVRIVIYGPQPNNEVLASRSGKYKWHPIMEGRDFSKRPNYLIISIDGAEEVYVQREYGPKLWIADSAEIRSMGSDSIDPDQNQSSLTP